MAGALIRYVCRSTAHQHARSGLTSPVTLHQNEWAFCPAGFIGEHTWEQIEGETLETLRRRSAEVRVRA
jgi:hypothetical protein